MQTTKRLQNLAQSTFHQSQTRRDHGEGRPILDASNQIRPYYIQELNFRLVLVLATCTTEVEATLTHRYPNYIERAMVYIMCIIISMFFVSSIKVSTTSSM